MFNNTEKGRNMPADWNMSYHQPMV